MKIEVKRWKDGRDGRMEGWKKTYLRLFCSERCEGSASFKSFQPHRANTSAFHRVLCVRLAFAVHGFTVRRRPHKRDRSISEVNSEF